MSTDDFKRNDPETTFTYGVSELRQAGEAPQLRQATAARDPRPARGTYHPALGTVPYKAAKDARGFDPYNSGGFDSKRNWARIRKR